LSASLELAVLVAYFASLGLLAVLALHRAWLLARFRPWTEGVPTAAGERLPSVTVQLPVYNERAVVARVLRAAGRLDYPRERLELQVLDDSTDETSAIVDREVALLQARGVRVEVLRRARRTGYKAGALAAALGSACGELIAIFDADFDPPASFLRDVVGAFDDPAVGLVQARWGHENRDSGPLTRAQATLLDSLFVVEHHVRHRMGLFFNFNGTAGVWRRAAIESAGGWSHDTLTEDLDLSYRAQLAGWRFVYAPAVVAPAELPPEIGAFKSQQRRWATGGLQVLRKLGPQLAGARAGAASRIDALLHLAAHAAHPLVLSLALLLPLMTQIEGRLPGGVHLALFVLCATSLLVYYERGQRALGRSLGRRLGDTLAAIVLGLGLSLSQTGAVLAGFRSTVGEFVRTPKRAAYPARSSRLPGAELLVAAWLLVGAVAAVRGGSWGSLPFLMLFFVGFAWVGVLSLRPVSCPDPSTPIASPPSRSTATAR
jgi:hypothetical protein